MKTQHKLKVRTMSRWFTFVMKGGAEVSTPPIDARIEIKCTKNGKRVTIVSARKLLDNTLEPQGGFVRIPTNDGGGMVVLKDQIMCVRELDKDEKEEHIDHWFNADDLVYVNGNAETIANRVRKPESAVVIVESRVVYSWWDRLLGRHRQQAA
jgi:hypothetical protein